MDGRCSAATLPAGRPGPARNSSAVTERADLSDLLIVFAWPPVPSDRPSPAGPRSFAARLARSVTPGRFPPSTARSASPAGPGTGCSPDRAAAVLIRMAICGAHVLVVSAGQDSAAAELRELGLLPHLRGVALGVGDLTAYLLDHRCRRDRAVFVGHRERDLMTATRTGYEVIGLCDSPRSASLRAAGVRAVVEDPLLVPDHILTPVLAH